MEEKNPAAKIFVHQSRPRGLSKWIPLIETLSNYKSDWVIHDIIAGLVLTAILVPVGMAYASVSGLPAIYGLYATIIPLIAYALFGPSKILVLGPDSALAGLIAAAILPLAAGNPDKAIALAGMLAVLAELDNSLHDAGMDLSFAEMKGPVKDMLKRYGLFTRLGVENFFPTIEQAVERYLAAHKID